MNSAIMIVNLGMYAQRANTLYMDISKHSILHSCQIGLKHFFLALHFNAP